MPAAQLWSLTNIDMTGLGGPMGTERTQDRWVKYFTSDDKAKRAAEKDFKARIEWKKQTGGWTSGDLLHTMYKIRPIQVEE